MQITIEKRVHYGTPMYYVTGEHASAVRTLTGNKTVSLRDIEALRSLGFTITIQGE